MAESAGMFFLSSSKEEGTTGIRLGREPSCLCVCASLSLSAVPDASEDSSRGPEDAASPASESTERGVTDNIISIAGRMFDGNGSL